MTYDDYLKARKMVEKAVTGIEGDHLFVMDQLGKGTNVDLKQFVKYYRDMSVTAAMGIDQVIGFCLKNGYAMNTDFLSVLMELHAVESLARMLSMSFYGSSKSRPLKSDLDSIGAISDAISSIGEHLHQTR
jgi:hypothetical protein